MRKVDKNFNNVPKLLVACASSNEVDLLTKKAKGIKQSCYKKAETELLDLYYEKCAYCETKFLKNSDDWLEHYRPKSQYYWLAYEWSNLLPTCIKCNRSKKANFPLINSQIYKPTLLSNGKLDISKNKADSYPLKDENPYLLHPEIDNPVDYFSFEIDENKNGINIVGTDSQNRGKKTIEICNLNRIEGKYSGLPFHRQKDVIDGIVKSINKLLNYLTKKILPIENLYKALKIEFDNIKTLSKDEKLEHTLLRQYVIDSVNNFERIICPYIEDENQQKIILEAFKIYNKNN